MCSKRASELRKRPSKVKSDDESLLAYHLLTFRGKNELRALWLVGAKANKVDNKSFSHAPPAIRLCLDDDNIVWQWPECVCLSRWWNMMNRVDVCLRKAKGKYWEVYKIGEDVWSALSRPEPPAVTRWLVSWFIICPWRGRITTRAALALLSSGWMNFSTASTATKLYFLSRERSRSWLFLHRKALRLRLDRLQYCGSFESAINWRSALQTGQNVIPNRFQLRDSSDKRERSFQSCNNVQSCSPESRPFC